MSLLNYVGLVGRVGSKKKKIHVGPEKKYMGPKKKYVVHQKKLQAR